MTTITKGDFLEIDAFDSCSPPLVLYHHDQKNEAAYKKNRVDDGISIEDVHVGLQLTNIKPIHAGWLVEFYNHMTTSKGKEIIDNGWKAAGISDF